MKQHGVVAAVVASALALVIGTVWTLSDPHTVRSDSSNDGWPKDAGVYAKLHNGKLIRLPNIKRFGHPGSWWFYHSDVVRETPKIQAKAVAELIMVGPGPQYTFYEKSASGRESFGELGCIVDAAAAFQRSQPSDSNYVRCAGEWELHQQPGFELVQAVENSIYTTKMKFKIAPNANLNSWVGYQEKPYGAEGRKTPVAAYFLSRPSGTDAWAFVLTR